MRISKAEALKRKHRDERRTATGAWLTCGRGHRWLAVKSQGRLKDQFFFNPHLCPECSESWWEMRYIQPTPNPE